MVQVKVGDHTITLHVAMVAGKGDWPYVRKCYGLTTGFQCPRICHMCPKIVSWLLTPGRQPFLGTQDHIILWVHYCKFKFITTFFRQPRHGGTWGWAILYECGIAVRDLAPSSGTRELVWEPSMGLMSPSVSDQTKCMSTHMVTAKTLLPVLWFCALAWRCGQGGVWMQGWRLAFRNSDLGVNAIKNPPACMNFPGKFSRWVSSLDDFGKGSS